MAYNRATETREARYRRIQAAEIREFERQLAAQDLRDTNPEWLKCMAGRRNTLHNKIPHYPIFVEHIREYTTQSDYEVKFVKTIQTIGEIIPDSERWGNIATLTHGKFDQFPVNFDRLKLDQLYIKDAQGMHLSVWEKFNTFKVFGILESMEGRIVLKISKFARVRDMNRTIEVMTFLSRIAQCTYEQYGKELENNQRFRDYWNAAKLNGKRRVQKKKK